MKKYGIIPGAAVLVVVVALAAFLFTKGEDSSETLPQEGPLELAVIDGEPFVIDGGLDALKMQTFLYGNASVSGRIRFLVEEEVIADKAEEDGMTVSDEEVRAYVDEWLSMYRGIESDDSEGFQIYERMLADMGLTDEEFFRMFSDCYRSELLAGKYRDMLKERVERDASGPTDFQSYWQEHKEKLIKEADVQYSDAYFQASDIDLSDI
ncbi:MAG: hypothetical protein ACI4PP_03360 [Clostridia bacterium]